MLFNSLEFAIFLPLSFLLYWFVFPKNLGIQNFYILLCSYIFYAWWDWRFLALIMASTLVDYFVGLSLEKYTNKKKRKILLSISILFNLSLLGFFKYFNFFLDNLYEGLELLGVQQSYTSLNILLPVGISFYTFQTMSYTIDVYKKKIEPTKDLIAFAAFVSFFPQLVAGPIERAKKLLPQFQQNRQFKYSLATDGVKQILWGLFKKVVIADNCAIYVNQIFDNSEVYSGNTLFIGAFLFAFQIYGDFSGYSDIAIGTAKLFGIRLSQNFAFPYFSKNIAVFWKRWHISLSTWFRDYLYIPLGGSRGSRLLRIRNVLLVFLISGLWHGANWTFIVWGAVHALLFLPVILISPNSSQIRLITARGGILSSLGDSFKILFTFIIVVLSWIVFRAKSLEESFLIYSKIFSVSILEEPQVLPGLILLLIIFFMSIEWFGRNGEHALQFIFSSKSRIVRMIFYMGLAFMIYMFQGKQQEFIYFQF